MRSCKIPKYDLIEKYEQYQFLSSPVQECTGRDIALPPPPPPLHRRLGWQERQHGQNVKVMSKVPSGELSFTQTGLV